MNINSFNIENEYPQLNNKKILLAVSGGVDSMTLLHLFSLTKLNFSIAHCNYNLRSNESLEDEFLVKKIAKKLKIELHIKNINTKNYLNKNKLSVQIAARKIRYDWFNSLIDKYHFSYIITAHHLDDQLETLLINIGRGSGIEGLIGIPESKLLLRPLLNFTKKEILTYANDNNVIWNEDSSNSKNNYLRNSIRNLLIPKWKDLVPDLEKNLKKTINNLKSTNFIINELIRDFKNINFIKSDHGIRININELKKLNPNSFFLHAIFKKYGFNHPNEIIKIINSQKGKRIESVTHVILRDREDLILNDLNKDLDKNSYQIKLIPQRINTPINIEISNNPFSNLDKSISVDPTLLNSILEIKRPTNGDYFYPSGMIGKKKLSKYFKDEKYSKFDKENQWILTSQNEVVWIIGKRADRRFISNKNSKKRMYISID
ncbi:MAG: tRNA lysidine(34) synthetase TilS [Flavobacteriaceae bacterium]|nr:tRNA lysidine(34) synthetase TilS [Flavobacteriaceae bacterium]